MTTLSQVVGAYVSRLVDNAERDRPLDGTGDAIRRKRATRRGVTVAASVVGIGIVFAGGVVGARYWDSIQPPWYYLPDGGGTVQIAVDGPDPTIPDLGIACGDPAPVGVPAADGFEAEVTLNTNPTYYEQAGYLDGAVKITNSNTEEFPGFVLSPSTVVVRDGVVVAIENNYGLVHRLTFTPGRRTIPHEFSVSGWSDCPEFEEGHLPNGDYEFYVVTTVASSPELAAMSRASDVYGQGPWFNGDKWLEPTDWECATNHSESAFSGWSGNSSACLSRTQNEFTWDAQTRTVSMPYGDGQVTRVFSTQLVSGPFAYTSNDEYWSQDYPQAENAYPVDDPTAPCGAEVQWNERGSEASFATSNLSRSSLDKSGQVDAQVWVPFGPGGVESRTATVGAPPPRTALLTQWGTTVHEGYESGAEFVVGRATVTVNRGHDIVISRATGPATVPLVFDDIEWCDGAAPTDALSVYVIAPLTITGDDKHHQAQWFSTFNWMTN